MERSALLGMDLHDEDVATDAVEDGVGGGSQQQPETVTRVRADDDEVSTEFVGFLFDLVGRHAEADMTVCVIDAMLFAQLAE